MNADLVVMLTPDLTDPHCEPVQVGTLRLTLELDEAAIDDLDLGTRIRDVLGDVAWVSAIRLVRTCNTQHMVWLDHPEEEK